MIPLIEIAIDEPQIALIISLIITIEVIRTYYINMLDLYIFLR